MRIKLNGQDLDRGDRVTIDNSSSSDSMALVIIIAGLIAIVWIIKGGLFL